MMKLIGKLFLTTLVASTVVYGADKSIGTWKLNIDKSKSDSGVPMPKSVAMTREPSDEGVRVTSTGERQDGTQINTSFTAKYDGKDYPVTGGRYDSISLKEVDANTHTFITKKDGKDSGSGRAVISDDGKTMTITTTGTNAEGKKFNSVSVYDKQ